MSDTGGGDAEVMGVRVKGGCVCALWTSKGVRISEWVNTVLKKWIVKVWGNEDMGV